MLRSPSACGDPGQRRRVVVREEQPDAGQRVELGDVEGEHVEVDQGGGGHPARDAGEPGPGLHVAGQPVEAAALEVVADGVVRQRPGDQRGDPGREGGVRHPQLDAALGGDVDGEQVGPVDRRGRAPSCRRRDPRRRAATGRRRRGRTSSRQPRSRCAVVSGPSSKRPWAACPASAWSVRAASTQPSSQGRSAVSVRRPRVARVQPGDPDQLGAAVGDGEAESRGRRGGRRRPVPEISRSAATRNRTEVPTRRIGSTAGASRSCQGIPDAGLPGEERDPAELVRDHRQGGALGVARRADRDHRRDDAPVRVHLRQGVADRRPGRCRRPRRTGARHSAAGRRRRGCGGRSAARRPRRPGGRWRR